jgi:outer membrane receptor protein involved in Fe transport
MALLLTLLLTAQSLAMPGISGTVRDSSGQVIVGATVIARFVNGAEQQTVSGPDGRFSLAVAAPGDVTLLVRANSFDEFRRTLPAGAASDVSIVLTPASLSETVTVTASRMEQRLRDVPASVSVLNQEDIRRSPAVVADDVLRQVPTFSLFRRTSSLASHPTAQGVSLRGIGPSGVSRTLVLLDSVPFNDPFGGWVYWTRVPLDSADRIEVVDTASSSLYGNYAMGGVINIMTAGAMRRTLDVKAQYGNRNSPKVDFRASDVWGRLGLVFDGAAYSTDGYPIVVDVNPAGVAERGKVDKNSSVEFRTFNLKGEYSASDNLRAFVRAGHFREERINGKASTIDGTDEKNDTSWTSVNGGVRAVLGGGGELEATIFSDFETFRSNFLAVPAATPPRSIGRMTLNQRVPSTAVGGMVQWSRAFSGKQFFSAGGDWRWVDGDSEEDGLDAVTGTQVTLKRNSGGTQRSIGVFVQDVISPVDKVTVTLSARLDQWRNYEGHNLEAAYPSGVPTANNAPALPDRDDTVLSPRVAARYHINSKLSVWGDIGAGFRAPTLNELYRQFRVGTVLTLANNQLGPERLVGGEFGATYMPRSNILLRSTWFDNRVKDPVSNVTISTVGANVTQQRQNLGRTRIRGLQTDAEVRLGTSWRIAGGYLYEQAKVREFAANPALVGKFLAQVPEHRGSVQVVYSNPKYVDVAFLVQALGAQFDDDLNVRTVPGISEPGLPGYGLASLTASRAVGRNFEAFFGVQNLFDQEYFVGTLPTTVGSPRLLTGGVRVRWAGRTQP